MGNYGPRAKSSLLLVFMYNPPTVHKLRWLLHFANGWKKIKSILFRDTWKLHEIQTLVPTNKVLVEHIHAQVFPCHLWLLMCYSSKWEAATKAVLPQSLEYLPSDPLQKMSAHPRSKLLKMWFGNPRSSTKHWAVSPKPSLSSELPTYIAAQESRTGWVADLTLSTPSFLWRALC